MRITNSKRNRTEELIKSFWKQVDEQIEVASSTNRPDDDNNDFRKAIARDGRESYGDGTEASNRSMRLTLSPSWNTEGKGEEYELVVVGYEGGLALSAHNSDPLAKLSPHMALRSQLDRWVSMPQASARGKGRLGRG